MKTKLLFANLKDLIFLANNQLAEGHAEAGGMVIKAVIDKFPDYDTALDEAIQEKHLAEKKAADLEEKLAEAVAALPSSEAV